uniref:Uncharacterized protein n=1 Tax=Rhizophora mucronata TaxID=61149 RepID=A0A2P2QUH9_RHIMU
MEIRLRSFDITASCFEQKSFATSLSNILKSMLVLCGLCF